MCLAGSICVQNTNARVQVKFIMHLNFYTNYCIHFHTNTSAPMHTCIVRHCNYKCTLINICIPDISALYKHIHIHINSHVHAHVTTYTNNGVLIYSYYQCIIIPEALSHLLACILHIISNSPIHVAHIQACMSNLHDHLGEQIFHLC